ncbi:MAG: hypothetical protein WAQ05_22955, partial [Rubrivivax sp.]
MRLSFILGKRKTTSWADDAISDLTHMPLLKFQWVLGLRIWRLGGVKGGRSPAQRTLDADQAPIRCCR